MGFVIIYVEFIDEVAREKEVFIERYQNILKANHLGHLLSSFSEDPSP